MPCCCPIMPCPIMPCPIMPCPIMPCCCCCNSTELPQHSHWSPTYLLSHHPLTKSTLLTKSWLLLLLLPEPALHAKAWFLLTETGGLAKSSAFK